tara:strand:- start:245 stop:433 length:189 start_codon:yes stop_codon:yes gene_type:complete
MKKYKIVASQTQTAQYEIEVKAKNQDEAEKIALKKDINDWDAYDPYNEDALSVDEVEEIKGK